ncbi:MAG: hypothetical protein IJ113_02990 [Eggerthellaceae bacterium]|nr:hypothetical protein [Eggerthellaceae bacterium]
MFAVAPGGGPVPDLVDCFAIVPACGLAPGFAGCFVLGFAAAFVVHWCLVPHARALMTAGAAAADYAPGLYAKYSCGLVCV